MSKDKMLCVLSEIKKSNQSSETKQTCYVYAKKIKDRLDKINESI